MKSAKKSSKREPTITDVMAVVQDLSVTVQDLTEAVQIGFSKNDAQHDEINDSLKDVGYRVTALEKRGGSLEDAVDDMKESLDAVVNAVDKDSIAILNHERRIRRLEKASA